MSKLKTTKMGQCSGEHCSDLSRLGPYDVVCFVIPISNFYVFDLLFCGLN